MENNRISNKLILIMPLLMNGLADSLFSVQLPTIQNFLNINTMNAQWLITINLAGFALGMLYWGYFADRYGRSLAWNYGLVITIVSMITMCSCNSFNLFFIARFFQGLGASMSSVLSMVMIRDWFTDMTARSKLHATINQALGIAPILALILSSSIDILQWQTSYIVLIVLYSIILLSIQYFSFAKNISQTGNMFTNMKNILSNATTIKAIILIGIAIGIGRCYFGAMPYILNNMLGDNNYYKISLIFVGMAWIIGGYYASLLSRIKGQVWVIQTGSLITLLCSLIMLIVSLLTMPVKIQAITIIICNLIAMVGTGLIIPNAIALGLEPHTKNTGTASSILGFGFYVVTMLMQFIFTLMPQNELWSMPVLFVLTTCGIFYISLKFYSK